MLTVSPLYILLVLDPKLKKVSFEYMVNGQRIVQKDLTSTYLEKAFGNTEYSMAGEIKDILEINEDTNEIIEIETFEIVIKAENDVGSYKETLRLLNCNNQTEEPRALPTMVSDPQDINVINRLVFTCFLKVLRLNKISHLVQHFQVGNLEESTTTYLFR